MDSAGYITITRQMGLKREMQIVANNIANAATTGYRQEGMIFSEYVKAVENGPSLSMGQGNVHNTSFEQGTLSQTGGTFDFAIEGDGFFLIETPAGERLTRAGAFSPNADGDLVTYDGFRVVQGFVEGANVNAIGQLARMIEVQRAYEMGASFLEAEDKRVRQALESMTK